MAKPRDQWRAFGGSDAATVEEGAQGHLGSSATTTARKWAKVLGTDHRASGELCGHSSMKVTPGRGQSPFFDEKGGPATHRVASAGLLARRWRDGGVTEVSAAQPCTRSKTPRYGSTARSGSGLLEGNEEIVG